MAYTDPSIADFKAYFVRDFPYGASSNKVTNNDITKALADAAFFINEALFASQADYTLGFLEITDHMLVMNLRASSQGTGGKFSWLQTSKSAGGVSSGYQIPDRIAQNPELAILSETRYGAKFLFMILPYLNGQIFTVCGGTRP